MGFKKTGDVGGYTNVEADKSKKSQAKKPTEENPKKDRVSQSNLTKIKKS